MELTEKDKRRLAKLDALEAGGVDNWEWYDESLKDWFAENEKIEKAECFLDTILEIICSECEISEPAGSGCGYSINNTKPVLNFILESVEKFK